MAAALAILLFVVLPIGAVVVHHIVNRSASAAYGAFNRNVLRKGTHQDGENIIKNPLIFRTIANFDALRAAVANDVTAARQPSGGSWYLHQAGDQSDGRFRATFRIGAEPWMEAAVDMRNKNGTVVGSADVIKWTLSSGAVVMVDKMKFLRERVALIILSLDPAAELSNRSVVAPGSVTPPPAGPAR